MTNDTALPAAHKDFAVITLIGVVHGVSHFFQLVLPVLFPWLMAEFGLSFTRIGLAMTVFFVISGVGQAAAGFLVDRFGAARVLAAGLTCFVLAALLLAAAPGFAALIGVGMLAGMGNAVFHPADFTVLNRHVSSGRLGHAFSVHGLSGNLGWALAPVLVAGVAALSHWRVAALVAGAVAVVALVLLLAFRHVLADPVPGSESGEKRKEAVVAIHPLAFLRVWPVWMCFAFFFLITTAFGAFQNFATPILQQLYGLALPVAAGSLSAYLVGGAVGIIVGGFLAKQGQHDAIIAVMLGVAALMALLLASAWLPPWAAPLLMTAIGFCTGIAGPSRDLLVRHAATARFGQAAYGRIYGFVYSGLDAGMALAPFLFGAFMDAGRAASVLVGVAVLQGLAVCAAWGVGRQISAARPEAAT